MQSDRPLAAYRCSLYANSFLRDDEEGNHTRLWKVDLVDGLPGLLDDRPLLESRRSKVRIKKRKIGWGEGREQAILEMSVGPLLCHYILPGQGGKIYCLAPSVRPNDGGGGLIAIMRESN